ncbi:MBL fold metallo-hydrolase [Arthrobacter sp. 2MCAF15]|uniref:MBL fold metallo-hydrolase n=1 Tax=Arthrobacter sp. 2MCAF15 TaxID=3232984 RepID=UPI003F90009A
MGQNPEPETQHRREGTQPKPQAAAPATQPFGAESFQPSDQTILRWLGMAGFMINVRGTVLMVDPVLGGFDMPLLIDLPISPTTVPRLDAVLVTHSDNDHYSVPTCLDILPVTTEYHSTPYVASLMESEKMPAHGHAIGDTFQVGSAHVTVTPADHAWQNADPQPGQRVFRDEDACGFWIETPDGTIWAPGDSRLIPEHHLTMPAPDALLFDFSDSEWHFGLRGAVDMANAYPTADLLLHHWGSVDAPGFPPFNGNPADLYPVVVNSERIRVLAPGEPFRLRSH